MTAPGYERHKKFHHEGTKDTKVFVGCASRTDRSRNISRKERKGAKGEHCHFEPFSRLRVNSERNLL